VVRQALSPKIEFRLIHPSEKIFQNLNIITINKMQIPFWGIDLTTPTAKLGWRSPPTKALDLANSTSSLE
jgi:hypothetical protein